MPETKQIKTFVKRIPRLPSDALIASSGRLPGMIQRAINDDFSISSRHVPYFPEKESFLVPQQDGDGHDMDAALLPIPPQELWLNYGQTAEEYLDMGKRHVAKMQNIVQETGSAFSQAGKILDFGCSAGRMIRHLVDLSGANEIWGCDISAAHVLWCQQHLSPPFQFVTTTTSPHLPFEDRYFRFIYAGSVFTNLAELADAWLLELRRVLQPGGLLYVTVHDNHTREIFLNQYRHTSLGQLLQSYYSDRELSKTDLGMFAIYRTPGMTQVFYDIDFIQERWGCYMDIVSVTEEAYGPQTAVLMRKRA